MLVLVHGANFAASCWDRMLPHLDTPAMAVDLPGRGRIPAGIEEMTVDHFARSVVSQIVEAGLDELILVGHSAAGHTLPRVVELIPSRIRRLVFVSCVVPRHGQTSTEALELTGISDEFARRQYTELAKISDELATALFCNDMDEEQTALTLRLMVPDNPRISIQPMDLTGLRHGVPATWVRFTLDVIIPPIKQDRFIANLGAAGSVAIVDVEAGHMAMISRPRRLAVALNAIAAS